VPVGPGVWRGRGANTDGDDFYCTPDGPPPRAAILLLHGRAMPRQAIIAARGQPTGTQCGGAGVSRSPLPRLLGGRCGRARCAGRAGTTAQRGAAGGAEPAEARDAQAAARLGGGATALCAPICAAFATKTAPPFLPLKALILRGWPGRSLAGHLAAWQARLRGRASEQHVVGAGGSGRSGERFPPFARSRQPEQWYQRRYSAS